MKKIHSILKPDFLTILSFAFLLICNLELNAQIGKEFWFVAPDITEVHGTSKPVFIISSHDKPAKITIYNASTGAPIKTVTLAAYSMESVEIDKDLIENKPANSVNQKGIYIEASEDISVVYEVQASNNPDKFTLKGENALGTEFFIPSQTNFINVTQWYPADPPSEKFDLVATEDGTLVTIVPSHDIYADDQTTVLHKEGVPFTISLDKGETYNVSLTYLFDWSNSNTANFLEAMSYSLAGTEVTSNKPIAITVTDDSIGPNPLSVSSIGDTGNAADLIGDQLVPVSVLGTEYLALMGTQNNEDQPNYVYVVATEDGTSVEINGTVTTLQRGEQLGYKLEDPATYITSNNPVYAYQMTSYAAYELGTGILPPVNGCTGSESVVFPASTSGNLILQILVSAKDIDNFEFEVVGNPSHNLSTQVPKDIKAILKPVPGSGTGDEQMYTGTYPLNGGGSDKNFILRNTSGIFHLGIIDQMHYGGMSYGYISSFSSITLTADQECKGTERVINAKGNGLITDYEWYFEGTHISAADDKLEYTATQTGTYIVKGLANGGCPIEEEIYVDLEKPKPDLGPDETICAGVKHEFNLKDKYYSYFWSTNVTVDGSDKRNASVTLKEGESIDVTIEVMKDRFGCIGTDEVTITASGNLDIDVVAPTGDVCPGDKISDTKFKASNNYTYKWTIDGKTPTTGQDDTHEIEITKSGKYAVAIENPTGCSTVEEFDVVLTDLKVDLGKDESFCPGQPFSLDAGAGYDTYTWVNATANATDNSKASVTLSSGESAEVSVEVTKGGCSAKDEIKLTAFTTPDIDITGPLTGETVCAGQKLEVIDKSSGSAYSYKWTIDGAAPTGDDDQASIEIIHSGTYKVVVSTGSTCDIIEEREITLSELTVDLGVDESFCPGKTIYLDAGAGFKKYEWTNAVVDATDASKASVSLAAGESLSASVKVTNQYGCVGSDIIVLSAHKMPNITLDGPAAGSIVCPGERITVVDHESSTSNTYKWTIDGDEPSDKDDEAYLDIKKTGDYKVVATTDKGCEDSQSLYVELSTPSLDLGKDRNVCPGEEVQLAVNSGFSTYTWSTGVTVNPLANHEASIILKGAESITIKLDVLDATTGCDASDEVVITAFDAIKVELAGVPKDGSAVCPGVKVFDDLYNAANQYTYEWTIDNSPSGQANDYFVIANINGLYEVEVTDSHGCKLSSTITVALLPAPDVKISGDAVGATGVCPGSILTDEYYDATAKVTYKWTIDGVSPTGVDYTRETFEANESGMYQLTAANEVGCTGSDEVMVDVLVKPDYSPLESRTLCQGDSVVLDADYLGIGYAQYEWFYGMSPSTINYMADSIESEITISASGFYSVRAQTEDGCFWLDDTAKIDVVVSPHFTFVDTMIYNQISVLADGGSEPYVYAINDKKNEQYSSTFKLSSGGDYTLFVTDQNNCSDSLDISVSSEINVDVPNFFTPNGDGYNEGWMPKGIERFPESEIYIYNRFGKLLHKLSVDELPWNGDYLGAKLPKDTYWYTVKLMPIDKLMRGDVTLVH